MSDIFDHEADAWGSLEFDENEPTNWRSRPQCKYCQSKKVVWSQTSGGYRLFNYDLTKHTCKEYALHKL